MLYHLNPKQNLVFWTQANWFNDMQDMDFSICTTGDGGMAVNVSVEEKVVKKYKHTKKTKDGK